MFRLIRCLVYSYRTRPATEKLTVCIRNYSVLTKNVTKSLPGRRTVYFPKRTRTGRIRGNEGPKLEYDLEIDASKHRRIYTNPRKMYFNGIIIMALAPGAFFYNLAGFSFYYLREEDTLLESLQGIRDPSTWISKNKYRVLISVILATLGFVGVMIGLRYPSRCIRQMWLLKGGEQFRIVTFSPMSVFGRFNKKIIDVQINDVSAQLTRDPSNAVIPVQVKGYKHPHLLDNKYGAFHDLRLYDNTIGLKATFR